MKSVADQKPLNWKDWGRGGGSGPLAPFDLIIIFSIGILIYIDSDKRLTQVKLKLGMALTASGSHQSTESPEMQQNQIL